MTTEQKRWDIRDHFALPFESPPTHICEVKVPVGINMRQGKCKSILDIDEATGTGLDLRGGGRQVEILDNIDELIGTPKEIFFQEIGEIN